jgi:hypothetical protein
MFEQIDLTVKKAHEKAEDSLSPRSKMSAYKSALLKVREFANEHNIRSRIDIYEQELLTAAYRAEFEIYLDLAHKAEFKGNTQKAIDQYQEALYLLKTDNIPDDEQVSVIYILEEKIKELQSEV